MDFTECLRFKEDEKPEWLTMDEILEYSKKMIAQEE